MVFPACFGGQSYFLHRWLVYGPRFSLPARLICPVAPRFACSPVGRLARFLRCGGAGRLFRVEVWHSDYSCLRATARLRFCPQPGRVPEDCMVFLQCAAGITLNCLPHTTAWYERSTVPCATTGYGRPSLLMAPHFARSRLLVSGAGPPYAHPARVADTLQAFPLVAGAYKCAG